MKSIIIAVALIVASAAPVLRPGLPAELQPESLVSMNLTTPNLFPLPTWAPALQRVPTPLVLLNEAFAKGEKAH